MNDAYPKPPKRLRDLNGFGPCYVVVRMNSDLHSMKGMGLNSIYAIIGARENVSWLEVAKIRKTEILMRLDDLGLAPK